MKFFPKLIQSFGETLQVEKKEKKTSQMLSFWQIFTCFFCLFFFFLIFSSVSDSIFLEFLPCSEGLESRLSWKFRENQSEIAALAELFSFFPFCDSRSAHNQDLTLKFISYYLRDTTYLKKKNNFEKSPRSSRDLAIFSSRNPIFISSGQPNESIVTGAFVKRNDKIQTGKKK